MNKQIVYTTENDCRDCYKCIRHCPVQAITMVNHHASIDPDSCIGCGKCVAVCPSGAQHYRNDEEKVWKLLNSDKNVILSIAPSFISELELDTQQIIEQAKQVGFWGISETALGAQLVSNELRSVLSESNQPYYSTACPTFVHYILKHKPEQKDKLTPVLSPLLAHCKMLRKVYGDEIAIVFVGPCISKKYEADYFPELLDVAITFDELKNILALRDKNKKIEEKKFIPCESKSGTIYPLDGGMNETINKLSPYSVIDTKLFNFSGIDDIKELIDSSNLDNKNTFCEFLACKGGCINGPASNKNLSIITKKEKIADYFRSKTSVSEEDFIEKYDVDIKVEYNFIKPVIHKTFSFTEIQKIYKQLGKFKPEDFLNCGACGYDTCENFAIACLSNKAEITMCVSSMRKKAQDKAKSLIEAAPIAIGIVDREQKIIECNKTFISYSIDIDIDITDELIQRVLGSNVNKFFEIGHFIEQVFETKEILERIIKNNNRTFNLIVFPFKQNDIVGIFIQDITKTQLDKQTVINKTRQVIRNNLKTIQQIAYLLGETASETEIILNEIIKAFDILENSEEYE